MEVEKNEQRNTFKAKRKNWRELPKEEWWVEGNLITDEVDADVAYIGYVLGSEME